MAAIADDLVDETLHAPEEHRACGFQRLQSLGRQDHPHLSTVAISLATSHDEAKLLERADHAADHRGGDSQAAADRALAHLDRALDDPRVTSPARTAYSKSNRAAVRPTDAKGFRVIRKNP